MMRQIGLLILVILVEFCMVQSDCGFTKNACKNKGGLCQYKDTNCTGKLWSGKNFCENYDDCNCCADCSDGIKLPCKILNGKCMNVDDFCNGTEVIHNKFCRHRDTCKCCIPDCVCDPGTCTHENQDGRCSRFPLPDNISVGPQECKDGCQCYIPDNKECPLPNCTAYYENYLYDGKCRADGCLPMEENAGSCVSYPDSNCICCINVTEVCQPERCTYEDNNSVNYRGRCLREQPKNTVDVGSQECTDGCNCYINDTVCGPVCTSASVNPNNCQCVDGPCPEGTCFYDVNLCFGCSCCQISVCKSKLNQCTDPGDRCVDKFDNTYRICPKGFAKVYNTCFKTSTISNPPISVDCDCCKNLACRPIGDGCSKKGAFCIPGLAVCPKWHTTSFDCTQAVVTNGVWNQNKLCKCCTPYKVINGTISTGPK